MVFKVNLSTVFAYRIILSECNILYEKKNIGNKVLIYRKISAYTGRHHIVALPGGIQNWRFLSMSPLQGGS